MNVEHIDVVAGEDRTVTLRARDSANAAVSLSGKTITGYFGRRPDDPVDNGAVFTKTGTATVTASGVYTLSIAGSDTQYMQGDYFYQVKTVTSSNAVAVVSQGRFRVHPTVVA